ncbi:hypothetical protein [Calidifontibacillus erzurumensis]|uniref:hypothetical protein n=1 Tax=Calidifontibacillus erzurumensis TaxID=2741433 RepID=UPI001E6232F0|nr:hypothetical protein [Calidifontibacillus erzurumensis]
MNYKIFNTSWFGSQRKVTVINFKQRLLIEFTMDELEKSNLYKTKVRYINERKGTIETAGIGIIHKKWSA